MWRRREKQPFSQSLHQLLLAFVSALQPSQMQTLMNVVQSVAKSPKKSRRSKHGKPASKPTIVKESPKVVDGETVLPGKGHAQWPSAPVSLASATAVKKPVAQPWQLRSSDWTADVYNIEQFLNVAESKTATDDWSAVVLINDSTEAEELHALLLGFANLKLTLVQLASNTENLASAVERGEKGALWCLRSVPVRITSSISTRRVVVERCSENFPSLKNAIVKSTQVTAPAPIIVVRLSTEERYVSPDAFRQVLQKPGQIARVWLHALGSRELCGKCQDSWGFKSIGSGESATVSGMMRVDQSTLDQLLGSRFFCRFCAKKSFSRCQLAKETAGRRLDYLCKPSPK